MILIVDFGSQTTHLISRRIRELGVKTTIVAPEKVSAEIKKLNPKGIILSGSPFSVYEKNAPTIDRAVFNMKLPILGICYGQQLMAHVLNGKVTAGKKKEFGPARIIINNTIPLFHNLPKSFLAWMSHGDAVLKLPEGFTRCGETKTTEYAAIVSHDKKIYGIQFHPEVIHTQFGDQILKNFIGMCGMQTKKQTINTAFVHSIIQDIKESVGDQKVISALSGGVDSSVATLLVYKAIDNNVASVYIDSGLMRKDETRVLNQTFKDNYQMKVKIIGAQDIFLKRLKGITDPEKKRKIIGETFINLLEQEAQKTGAKFLVQGTIYSDVIESAGTTHSQKIKTHHNVARLPYAVLEKISTRIVNEIKEVNRVVYDITTKPPATIEWE